MTTGSRVTSRMLTPVLIASVVRPVPPFDAQKTTTRPNGASCTTRGGRVAASPEHLAEDGQQLVAANGLRDEGTRAGEDGRLSDCQRIGLGQQEHGAVGQALDQAAHQNFRALRTCAEILIHEDDVRRQPLGARQCQVRLGDPVETMLADGL